LKIFKPNRLYGDELKTLDKKKGETYEKEHGNCGQNNQSIIGCGCPDSLSDGQYHRPGGGYSGNNRAGFCVD